jgi:hypothetical protein
MKLESNAVRVMHNVSYTKFWKKDSCTNGAALEFLQSIPMDKIEGKMSRVNKVLTLKQVYNIYIDGLVEKPDKIMLPHVFKNIKKDFERL